MKLSDEQMALLKQLNDSYYRDAASLSCTNKKDIVEKLVKEKLAEPYGFGHRITHKGLDVIEKSK